MPEKSTASALEQSEKSAESNFGDDVAGKAVEPCPLEPEWLFDAKVEDSPIFEFEVEIEEAPPIDGELEKGTKA